MKKVTLLSLFLILLSGCFEYQEKMKINEDGSGEITFAIGVNESFFNMGEGSAEMKDFDENKIKEQYQNKKGVKFVGSKSYTKEGNKWIEVTLAFDSVSDLVNASQDSTSQNIIGQISLKQNEEGNMVFERILTTQDENIQKDTTGGDFGKGMMEAMFGQFKWKYELTLPGKIISTNAEANDVDKNTNTVRWAMSMASLANAKTLTVVYSTGSSLNITYLLLIVIAALTLGILLLRLLKRKKDRDVQSS